MPAAPYRRASTHAALWLFIILGSLAASIVGLAFYYGSAGRPSPATVIIVIAGAFLLSLIVAVLSIRRLQRRRWESTARALEPHGWLLTPRPDEPARAAAFAPIAHLERWADLRHGARGILMAALRRDSQARLLEHEYTTGSGKSTQVHTHTLIAWQVPPWWPLVRFAREGRLQAWVNRRAHGEDPAIGDADFDKAFRISGDEPFACELLTPIARAELMRAPKGESWVIGGGWAVMLYKGPLNAPNTSLFLSRALTVLGSFPKPLWRDAR